MRYALFFVPAICLAFQATRTGKLKPELIPNPRTGQTEPLEEATAAQRAEVPVQLRATDRVFIGSTFFRKDAPIKLALVEPEGGEAYLFADVNQSGRFDQGERFAFGGSPRAVVLRIPISAGIFRSYPIRLSMAAREAADGKGRMLLRSPFSFVEGTVEISGKPVLTRYMFDLAKQNSYPDWGWQGMDTDGDGAIREGANSEEFTFAKDEGVLFHVGDKDLSTVAIDIQTGTFRVREHAAGQNRRILLRVGDIVPDFSFTDLDGRTQQFAQFRAKHVLLDFWGTWCGPCMRELPELEKIHQRFGSRGLIVLGMGDDKDVEKVRKALSAAGVTYPQSTGEAGNALVYQRFRVNAFPTKVLLNGEGRVIAQGEALDREHLATTLERVLVRP